MIRAACNIARAAARNVARRTCRAAVYALVVPAVARTVWHPVTDPPAGSETHPSPESLARWVHRFAGALVP